MQHFIQRPTRAARFMLPALLFLLLPATIDAWGQSLFKSSFETRTPIILSTPPTTATIDLLYSYDVDAFDLDNDPLAYMLTVSPAGMEIDPVTGLIEWTPDTLGDFPVTVVVDDNNQGPSEQSWMITVTEIVDTDGDGIFDDEEIALGTDPNDPDTDDDGLSDGEEVNETGTDPLLFDTDEDGFGDGSELAFGTNPLDGGDFPMTPPDPASIAPEVDPSQPGSVFDETAFLYSGPDPIQTGVAPDIIEIKRAAVIRGKVVTRNGLPLPGATISVLQRAELGQTLSRMDGMYDLVVNGGVSLTLNFSAPGYLPAQRTIPVNWQEYCMVEDIALIPLDPIKTIVDLGTPGDKLASSSMSGDKDGMRQAAILFPEGVNANLVMPGGGTQPISNLSVRATEYTVGDMGPAAMPGDLPPSSAYTYAVELSVDEAIAMGADAVEFDQPLPFYLDNFLGFPAGTLVPTAFYDRTVGGWSPEPNGIVIKIIAINGGLAELDVDGDDIADFGAALTDLGITDSERAQMVGLYTAGESIWRIRVEHFTPYDLNWSFGAPPDAVFPFGQARDPVSEDNQTCPPEGFDLEAEVGGSIINCRNQVLGERLPIAGTPLSLNYRSNRVSGRVSPRQLDIPLTEGAFPGSLKRVELSVAVPSELFRMNFTPSPNLSHVYTWDGLDAYERRLSGVRSASIQVDYIYDGVYNGGIDPSTPAFGLPGEFEITGSTTRQEVEFTKNYHVSVGNWLARGVGLGGWTVSEHHTYDPANGILYRGDGYQRSTDGIAQIITNAAGAVDAEGWAEECQLLGPPPYACGDGLPATEAQFSRPQGIAFGPDGSMFIADFQLKRVRRVRPDGIVENFAGTGLFDPMLPNGDGGPAVDAQLSPKRVAADRFGNVYIVDGTLRKVDSDGIISTVAGGGADFSYPPNGVATELALNILDADVSSNGDVYFSTFCQIYRLTPDGLVTIVAGQPGQDDCGFFEGENVPATDAIIGGEGLALGPDGSIYLMDSGNYRVRRVTPDGIIKTIAGNGNSGFSGDGGPALQAEFSYSYGIAVASDGTIFIPDQNNYRCRRVGTDGVITTIAGGGPNVDESGLNGPATRAFVPCEEHITVGPDGNLYIATSSYGIVMTVRTAFAGLGLGEILVPSYDASEVYLFDGSGRHLQTLHGLTGGVLYEFTYDGMGRLNSITDGDGKVTTIQRNGAGHPVSITGHFGHVTMLSTDANGYLNGVTNPESESFSMVSTAGGLITQTTDPRGRISTYMYDTAGRLVSQSDNADYTQTLSRTPIADGFFVTRSTGLGTQTQYLATNSTIESRYFEHQAPDGSISASSQDIADASSISTSNTGTIATARRGADPRFGMQSPLPAGFEIEAPGGPTLSAEWTSEAVLSDSSDPFSIVTVTDTTTFDGRVGTRIYSATGNSQTITTPEGRQTTVYIDSLGRIVGRQFADRAPSAFTYTPLGQLETVTVGTGPDARTYAITYGPDGSPQSITDPLGRSTTFVRDSIGRVTQKTFPDTSSVTFDFDAAGNLVGIIPPGRPQHSFNYNLHGQILSSTPPTVPGSGPTTLAYDNDQRLTGISRPGNEQVSFSYDAFGRVSNIEAAEDGVVTATYDFSYHVDNQLDAITGPGAQSVHFSFQGDLLTQKSWSGPVVGSIGWTYDNAFRIATETVSGTPTLSFSYDEDNFRTGAGDLTISRHAINGIPESATLGVTEDTWSFDVFGLLENYTSNANSSPVYSASMIRDELGRITQKIETIEGVTDTYEYDYDLMGQLTEVQKNSVVVESYSYDDNGNRLSGTVEGLTSFGTYDDQDRLLQYGDDTYLYSPAGRLVSRTEPGNLVTSYDYDAVGNLRELTLSDSTAIEYEVDGLDRRTQRSLNASMSRHYLWVGNFLVAELDDMNNVVSRFVYAGSSTPAYMIKGGVNYRIVRDQIGSVRLVVNATTGAIEQRIDYDSFGRVLNDTNPGFQPFGFSGGLYDFATELTRFGSRDYDPQTGRWTARDPIDFAGGDTNLYRYVHNDPINYRDFDGLDSDSGWSFDDWWNSWDWDTLKQQAEDLLESSGGKQEEGGGWLDKAKKGKEKIDKVTEVGDDYLEVSDILEDQSLSTGEKGLKIFQCLVDYLPPIPFWNPTIPGKGDPSDIPGWEDGPFDINIIEKLLEEIGGINENLKTGCGGVGSVNCDPSLFKE